MIDEEFKYEFVVLYLMNPLLQSGDLKKNFIHIKKIKKNLFFLYLNIVIP